MNNSEYSGQIINNTLHLPLTDLQTLKQWLLHQVIPHLEGKKTIIQQRLEKPIEKLNYNCFQNIFSLLKKDTAVHKFILVNGKNNIALINTQNHEIWINENLKK